MHLFFKNLDLKNVKALNSHDLLGEFKQAVRYHHALWPSKTQPTSAQPSPTGSNQRTEYQIWINNI